MSTTEDSISQVRLIENEEQLDCRDCGRPGGRLIGEDQTCFSCLKEGIRDVVHEFYRTNPYPGSILKEIRRVDSLLLKAGLLSDWRFERLCKRDLTKSTSEEFGKLFIELFQAHGGGSDFQQRYLCSAIFLQLFLIPELATATIDAVKGELPPEAREFLWILRLHQSKLLEEVPPETEQVIEDSRQRGSLLSVLFRFDEGRVRQLCGSGYIFYLVNFFYLNAGTHFLSPQEAYGQFWFHQLESLFIRLYPLEQLKSIFDHYIKKVFDPADVSFSAPAQLSKLKKLEYSYSIATYITDPQLFYRIYERLGEKEWQILAELILTGRPIQVRHVVNQLDTRDKRKRRPSGFQGTDAALLPLCQQLPYTYFDSRPEYQFMVLPPSVRRHLSRFFATKLPRPEIEYTECGTDQLLIEGESILKHLPKLLGFLDSSGLRRSKTNRKILVSSLKELKLLGEVEEPYSDKDLGYMKTNLLGELLSMIRYTEKERGTTYVEIVKDALTGIFDHDPHDGYPIHLINHLGHIVLSDVWVQETEDHLRDLPHIIRAIGHILDCQQFVSLHELIRQLGYHQLLPCPIDYEPEEGTYRIRGDYSYYRVYDRNPTLTNLIYYDAVTRPYTALLVTILHLLGIVDICYDREINRAVCLPDKGYLTVYDGVCSVRLSSFGAYLFGTGEAVTHEVEMIPEPVFHLDPKKLVIRVENPDTTCELVLKRFAEKIGSSIYAVSAGSFLRDCSNSDELSFRIKQFESIIAAPLPRNWDEFFDQLLSKAELLRFEGSEYYSFTFEHVDEELRSAFATDEYLKKTCIKAQGGSFFILKADYKQVAARLKGYGILLPPTAEQG